MSLTKKGVLTLACILAGVVLVLALAPAPLSRILLTHWGSQWLGARVDIKAASYSWWPTSLVLEGVAITNPLKPTQNAIELARVQADIDLIASLQGLLPDHSAQTPVLQIPLLHITDISVAIERTQSGALPNEAPRKIFGTQVSAGFQLPRFESPSLYNFVATENSRYRDRVTAFARDLSEKQISWQKQVEKLPDDKILVGYEQRWQQLAKDRKMPTTEKIVAQQALLASLTADLKRLRKSHEKMRSQWQGVQTRYAVLRQLPVESLVKARQEHGVSEGGLSRLGQGLMQEKVREWLNTALNVHKLLVLSVVADNASTASHPGQAWVLIKKTIISGSYFDGAKRDDTTAAVNSTTVVPQGNTTAASNNTIHGEILNISDVPQWLSEPSTLNIEARGEAGIVQLSAMMDHRVAGKDIDRFNFSVKGAPLQQFPISTSHAMKVTADRGFLSLDLAGSIEQRQRLDMNLSGVFSGLTLEVERKNTDNSAARVLAEALQATNTMTVTARASGELNSPSLQMTSSLDDAFAVALHNTMGNEVSGWQMQLQQRLDTAMQSLLVMLDSDLAQSSAVLTRLEQRLVSFEATWQRWTPTKPH